MEIVKGSNEQIVASEAFTPVLSGEYIERYSTLLLKLQPQGLHMRYLRFHIRKTTLF